MKKVSNKEVAQLMIASITRPINVVLAVSGLFFIAAGLVHPGVGAAVLLLGAVYCVWRDLNDSAFIVEVLSRDDGDFLLPEIPENLAGPYRLECLEARRHLEKTLEAIDAAGPKMMEELRPVREQILQSVKIVYQLAERANHIERAVSANSRNAINTEIEKLKAQLVLTTDPTRRKYLERTREQKEEKLSTYEDLALHLKRLQTQMRSVNATLENLQFKIIKLGRGEDQAPANE